ncbi:hypothetical protein BDP27DRAFT_1357013 [Rhodocollybia butyracea]|uniref:SET domain-containing protein n=1 Tax=Rhodocollybia butyracea TaxID=206335 RepID=A0A9P5Q8L9_9AGAR|nr:hypothetical protein BDP27DRAFT_1357013 [Rhodocollybia butyracea]
MKRGFLTTSKAKSKFEKAVSNPDTRKVPLPLGNGRLSYGVVPEAGEKKRHFHSRDFPKDTRSQSPRNGKEIDPDTLDYAPGVQSSLLSPRTIVTISISLEATRNASFPERSKGSCTGTRLAFRVFLCLPLEARRTISGKLQILGVFATRLIRAGDLIVDERPMIVTPTDIFSLSENVFKGDYTLEQQKQIALHEWQQLVRQLASSHQQDGSDEVFGRMRTNAVHIDIELLESQSDDSTVDCRYSGVCKDVSRVNHSCGPNSEFSWHDDTFSVRLHAVRDIPQALKLPSHIARFSFPLPHEQRRLRPMVSLPASALVSVPPVFNRLDLTSATHVEHVLSKNLLSLSRHPSENLILDMEKALFYAHKLRGAHRLVGKKEIGSEFLSEKEIRSKFCNCNRATAFVIQITTSLHRFGDLEESLREPEIGRPACDNQL